MLLIILLLLWGVFLIPMVVRRIRDWRSDQSIEHFHEEHDVLGRQAVVAPVHRLNETEAYDQYDQYDQYQSVPARRPRLTVVHDDDTYQTLETRSSWDEWSDDYEFDQVSNDRHRDERIASASPRPTNNRYAAAYSATPRPAYVQEAPVRRSRSMRARRRVMFTRLGFAALILSVIGVFTGYSLVWDLAIIAWIGVVAFVALAFYAVGQGYLHESSLGLNALSRRPVAPVEPLFDRQARRPRRSEPEYDEYFEDADFEGYGSYDPRFGSRPAGQWRDEQSERYALG